MDIVVRLRKWAALGVGEQIPEDLAPTNNWGPVLSVVHTDAADTIEFLRTEVDRLGNSLNKCHAKLMRANCPVVDARNSEEA